MLSVAPHQAESIPIPGILGIVVGLAIGWFIFRAGKEASLKKLLIASTVLLLFIAGEVGSESRSSTCLNTATSAYQRSPATPNPHLHVSRLP